MAETARCPFCGSVDKQYPEIGLDTHHHYAVKCYNCGAKGPKVEIDPEETMRRGWEEATAPVREEATRLWNERVPQRVTDHIVLPELTSEEIAATDDDSFDGILATHWKEADGLA